MKALVSLLLISVLSIGGYFVYQKQSEINKTRNEEEAHNASQQLIERTLKQAEQNLANKIETAISNHEVIIGMKKDDVRLAIGDPKGIDDVDHIDISHYRNGSRELWYYQYSSVFFDKHERVHCVLKNN